MSSVMRSFTLKQVKQAIFFAGIFLFSESHTCFLDKLYYIFSGIECNGSPKGIRTLVIGSKDRYACPLHYGSILVARGGLEPPSTGL